MSRKVPPQKPNETSTLTPTAPAKTETHALELPNGAMIAFRKTSGGNVTEFFLYPTGRISFNVPDHAKEMYAHPSRTLNDAQINHLRHLLDQANFYRAASAQGKPSSDKTAYEISARVHDKANAIELFDGNIPVALKPLVEELSALLPREENATH